jgi:hypothetical protein
VSKPAPSPRLEPVHGDAFASGGIIGFKRNSNGREKPVR